MNRGNQKHFPLAWAVLAAVLLVALLLNTQPARAEENAASCVRFEDLTLNAVYVVNDPFSSDGLVFEVKPFVFVDGTPTSAGSIKVGNGFKAGGMGQELNVANANLQLKSVPNGVLGAALRFGDDGGTINLQVNGDLRTTADLVDLDGALVGGVKVQVIVAPGGNRGELMLIGPISALSVGGQEFYVDQMCLFREPAGNPNDPPAGDARPDLGDAPDSSNPSLFNNTAYPSTGVYGYFPTVWTGTPAGAGTGPKHLNAGIEGILGERYSKEMEAMPVASDADGINNILAGGGDNANNDLFDDGWRNRDVALVNCQEATLRVRVARGAATTLNRLYLNVWFDGNRDGDWQDIGACEGEQFPQGPVQAFEWIVQNYAVSIGAIPAGGFVDIPVNSVLVLNTDAAGQPAAHWLRFTLSEQPALLEPVTGRPDGRGPDQPNAFKYGETEDYLRLPGELGQPGLLTVEKMAAMLATPVQPGDRMTYTVRIAHVGGVEPALTTMKDILPAGVSPAGPVIVTEESPAASPLLAHLSVRTVQWAGALTPGAKIAIQIPVRVDRCLGQGMTIVNTAYVRQTDGTIISASVTTPVQCPEQPAVHVEKRIVVQRGDAEVEVIESEIFPGGEAIFRFKATNSSAVPVIVELRDKLPQGLVPMAGGDGRFLMGNRLRIEPGATASFDMGVRLARDFVVERPLVNIGRYVACSVSERFGAVCAWPAENDPMIQSTNAVTLTVQGSDLGDAPDSTNHLGAAMTAYAGVPANFPTVADPVAAPPGPLHANPRPFHLGVLVSREANADVGPDADPTNNLLPLLDKADRDHFDDGLRPPTMVLSDCKAATIPVKVFVAPEAVAQLEQGKGYLNIWVDANRDGDWADVRDCAQVTGGPALAFEHVVIDYPIDAAALGAGLHLLGVPTTGVAPWPVELAAQPTWVRATLSERPSNKTLSAGGVAYGDGQGYATAFRLGESEDYLWRAGLDSKNGPDVVVHKQGAATPAAPVTQTLAADGSPVAFERLVWVVEYANRGNVQATGVQVGDDLSLAGDLGTLEIKMEPALSYTLDGAHVVFAVGSLDPGQHGRIVVKTGVPAQSSGVFTNVAQIVADVDADPDNNVDDATVQLGLRGPQIVDPGDGTTCENQLTVRGRAIPGSAVDLYVDGALTAAVNASSTGLWTAPIALADGDHTLYALARLGGLTSPASRTVNITVNSGLGWSPLSLRFTDKFGRSHRPVDDEGRTDETGWDIRLRPGEVYTVSVKLCCTAPNAAAQLVISGTLTVDLTDPDGDHVYSGLATASTERHMAQSFVLTVQCGETAFSGGGEVLIDPEGVVYDVKTAAALSGAAVACQQAQVAAAGDGTTTVYDLWLAADYGQVNPQSTGADGYFSFFTPAGTYRLAVSRSGYQPYRSADIAVVSEAVHVDVPLSPEVAEPASHVIVITEYGFEPAYLAVGVGDVVEWVNMATGEHTATSLQAQAASADATTAADLDSGLLLPGERYKVSMTTTGAFTVVDSTNASNTATLVVRGMANGMYLPLIKR